MYVNVSSTIILCVGFKAAEPHHAYNADSISCNTLIYFSLSQYSVNTLKNIYYML